MAENPFINIRKNKIGMVWSLSDYDWMKMYDLAVVYYSENGNLLIPKDYRPKDNICLGTWIERQKKLHQDNSLSKKKVTLLNKIGMEWNGQKLIING